MKMRIHMKKIIVKTIKKSYANWNPSRSVRCYHYAAAFNGNKMIAFAQNNPNQFDAKAFRMGQIFNIDTYKEYPYPHAESYLVAKLLNRYNYISPNWSIVVLRINREGRILLSKPCKNCQKILDALNLKNIFYSDNLGNFVSLKEERSAQNDNTIK